MTAGRHLRANGARRSREVPSATVVIVGAGPAGLGVARVLRDLAVPGVRILERDRIGASFRRWPRDMQFISPSFTGNAFGLTDLNAVSFDSSPAFALKREHPTGDEYADYLSQAATIFGLDVTTGVDVERIEPDGDEIVLHAGGGKIRARFVIWAAGQFQYPDTGDLAGSEHGIHSSLVAGWADEPGDEALVIGGYESGVDAAIGLSAAGKKVTLLSRSAPWRSEASDPSIALSPWTRQRLDSARRDGRITLIDDVDILGLERTNGHVTALAADGRSWSTASRPILATGFGGSTSLIDEWFDFDGDGFPVLTPQDESTVLPGLFLVGPEVKHRNHLFCYIYKFRQRFAVVGRAIAARLGMEIDALEAYRANNMFLDDLDCCDIENCRC